MTNQQRIDLMRQRLEAHLQPTHLHFTDDSHLHAGHAGARGGAGHFSVDIVAEGFVGKSRVQRHQMVYAAVGDLIPSEVHALAIRAKTPAEQA